MNKAILLLGSNLGDKMKNISTALSLINESIGSIKKKSNIIKTLPEEYISSNTYLNLGIIIETFLSPMQLLKQLKKIEQDLGRIRDSSYSGTYEDRIIDIDIIYFNNIIYESKKLVIPHKAHTKKRNFSKKIIYELI